jgi:sialic acid synthase SpsE
MEILRDGRPYVIAEIGGNHGGDVERAKDYMRAVADTGADATKFQIYNAEWLIDEDEPPLPLAGDDYETQYQRFKELELTDHEWEELVALADDLAVDFAASVFDRDTAEYVAEVSPFIKIASGDLTNLPLLRFVRKLGKPIVLSTGFATMDEISVAVDELPANRLILLHCIGSYPTPPGEAHLEMIDRLRAEFDVPIGYSDHTVGTLAPKAATAMGARVIEKHFTLDKSQSVGDHRLSATPEELAEIVEDSRQIYSMINEGTRETTLQAELNLKKNMRRSLATLRAVCAGDPFTEANLTALRPEEGISPLRYDEILGQVAARDLPSRTILHDDDIR